MPRILAAELDHITVDSIRSWAQSGDIIVDVIDKQNMTAGRFTHLRNAVKAREMEPLCMPMDLEKLDEKLRNIIDSSPTPWSTSDILSRTASLPGSEKDHLPSRERAYRNYNTLLRSGGRPSAPIDPGPSYTKAESKDMEHHIESHWDQEADRVVLELSRWERFRDYERQNRCGPTEFQEYRDNFHNFRKRRGILHHINLQPQFEQQTKLEQWEEYYTYELAKLHRVEKEMQRLRKEEERILSPDWTEQHRRAREKVEAQGKLRLRVQKQVLDREQQWLEKQFKADKKDELRYALAQLFQTYAYQLEANGLADIRRDGQDTRIQTHADAQYTRTDYEMRRWQAFREYQQSKRKSPAEFEKYKASLKDHSGQHDLLRGYRYKVGLQLDSRKQNELDEWTEYYFFEVDEEYRLRQDPNMQTPYNVARAIRSAEDSIKECHNLLGWAESQFSEIRAEERDLNLPSRGRRRPGQPRQPTRRSKRIALKARAHRDQTRSFQRDGKHSATLRVHAPQHSSNVSKPANNKSCPQAHQVKALRRSLRIRVQTDELR